LQRPGSEAFEGIGVPNATSPHPNRGMVRKSRIVTARESPLIAEAYRTATPAQAPGQRETLSPAIG